MTEFIITVVIIIFFVGWAFNSPLSLLFQNPKAKNDAFEKELRQNSNFNIHSIIYPIAFDLENRQVAIKLNNDGYYVIDQSLIKSISQYSRMHQKNFRMYGIEVHIHDFNTPYLDFWYTNAKTRDIVYSKISVLFNLQRY